MNSFCVHTVGENTKQGKKVVNNCSCSDNGIRQLNFQAAS